MTGRIQVEPATDKDVDDLLNHIRPEDADEVVLSGTFANPEQAITMSVITSDVVIACRCDGDLLCLIGARRLHPRDTRAILWELGTTHIRRHRREFLRASVDGLRRVMNSLPSVVDFYNYMPDHYATYRKWAERYMKAQFSQTAIPSITGVPFREFHIRKET